MHIPVATGASRVAQKRMGALWEALGLLLVAGRALNLGHFRGMRKILDGRVAALATENGMHAGAMFRSVDVDILALVGLHPLRAVTRQAGSILFQGTGFFWFCGSASGSEHARQ